MNNGSGRVIDPREQGPSRRLEIMHKTPGNNSSVIKKAMMYIYVVASRIASGYEQSVPFALNAEEGTRSK